MFNAFLLISFAANAQPASFFDSFEEDKGWFLFEEMVGGSACYATGIGEMATSDAHAYSGRRSLQLWANKSGVSKSNHLIAVQRLDNTGRGGRWTYSARVMIGAGSESYQTGPEISSQNTRQSPSGGFLTHTAAIQYQANRFLEKQGQWAVWKELSPGQGGWERAFEWKLKPERWYRISLEVDYDRNRYGWFTVEGEDGKRSVDLTAVVMAGEKKHEESAFALTLEGENLWSNCGKAGIFQQRFYYDDVEFTPTEDPKVLGVRPSAGNRTRQRFQFQFQAASADRGLSVVNILINSALDPRNSCQLAYSKGADRLHLMNETGEKAVDTMPGTSKGELENGVCKVTASSVAVSGATLLLDVEIEFNRKTFAGPRTIFLAARDGHGGNSGWINAGSWVVETLP